MHRDDFTEAWARISADLRRTSVLELELSFETSGDGWFDTVMMIDGRREDLGHWFLERGELAVAALANYLREAVFDEEIWGGWPICPSHGTHPLDPVMDQGRAVWRCPRGEFIVRIGDLGAAG